MSYSSHGHAPTPPFTRHSLFKSAVSILGIGGIAGSATSNHSICQQHNIASIICIVALHVVRVFPRSKSTIATHAEVKSMHIHSRSIVLLDALTSLSSSSSVSEFADRKPPSKCSLPSSRGLKTSTGLCWQGENECVNFLRRVRELFACDTGA